MVAMAPGQEVDIGREKEGIPSFLTGNIYKDLRKRDISTGEKESLPDKSRNKGLDTGQ